MKILNLFRFESYNATETKWNGMCIHQNLIATQIHSHCKVIECQCAIRIATFCKFERRSIDIEIAFGILIFEMRNPNTRSLLMVSFTTFWFIGHWKLVEFSVGPQRPILTANADLFFTVIVFSPILAATLILYPSSGYNNNRANLLLNCHRWDRTLNWNEPVHPGS